MIISKTSQYAIQTMIYIATQPIGTPTLIRDLAEKLQVPASYLAKVMQPLRMNGLVNSFRGPLGGFCLRKDSSEISLMDIVLITEGPDFTQSCILGLKVCSDETACPMHGQWKPIKLEIIDFLTRENLKVLSMAVREGKYQISDIPYELFPKT